MRMLVICMMTKNTYQCNACNYETPRRTNANRHIELVHKGDAIAFNNKTGKLSTQVINKPNKVKSATLDDEIIIEISSDMIGPFEKLELLVNFFPKDMKEKYLSDIIISSLLSSDPVKRIHKAIAEIRSEIPLTRFALYIANYKKMELSVAVAFIKQHILNSESFTKRKSEKFI